MVSRAKDPWLLLPRMFATNFSPPARFESKVLTCEQLLHELTLFGRQGPGK